MHRSCKAQDDSKGEQMKDTKVRDLKPGDLVDLEGDEYADTEEMQHVATYEYGVVDTLDVETPTCTVVYFTNMTAVGFPPDHVVQVDELATYASNWFGEATWTEAK